MDLEAPIAVCECFYACLFTWFSLLEKYAQPVLMIHSKLDEKIPFCEYFYRAVFAVVCVDRRYILFIFT